MHYSSFNCFYPLPGSALWPPSLPMPPSPRRAADVRLPPVAAAASSSRRLFTRPAATAALNTAVRWHAGLRRGPHQSHAGATANSSSLPPNLPHQTFSSSFFYLCAPLPRHPNPSAAAESTKEKKCSSLTGEKNTCEINLGCGRTEMTQQLLNLLLWHWLQPKQLFFFKFCFGHLACELSSGAVTRCLLLSLLKTSALPLASTPQPKLTSAPRREEKLW